MNVSFILRCGICSKSDRVERSLILENLPSIFNQTGKERLRSYEIIVDEIESALTQFRNKCKFCGSPNSVRPFNISVSGKKLESESEDIMRYYETSVGFEFLSLVNYLVKKDSTSGKPSVGEIDRMRESGLMLVRDEEVKIYRTDDKKTFPLSLRVNDDGVYFEESGEISRIDANLFDTSTGNQTVLIEFNSDPILDLKSTNRKIVLSFFSKNGFVKQMVLEDVTYIGNVYWGEMPY